MRYLIDFTNSATREEIDSYFDRNGLTMVATFDNFNNVFVVEANSVPPITEIVESVVDDSNSPLSLLGYTNAPGKEYPLAEFSTTDDNDWWKLTVFSKLDFTKPVQSLPRRGSSAIVYVVDSGINSNHPEFQSSDILNLFSFNNDFQDYHGHGTAIASILCGNTCSLSNPTVKSVKILQDGTPTYQSDLLAAFDSIMNDANQTTGKLHVVNLSWSISKNTYIENKIRTLIESGIVVVAAAGNSGVAIANVTPASMPEVITVGAFDRNLTPCNFSNYTGPLYTTNGTTNYGAIDVWGPGEYIRAASINGGYIYIAGTSFSCAIASAGLAYNSYNFRLSDNSIPDFILDNSNELKVWLSLRRDLLSLEGQYQNSENRIVVFLQSEKDDSLFKWGEMSGWRQVIGTGKKYAANLAHELSYKTFSIQDPLPEGLTLTERFLHGTIINNTNYPFVYQTQITRTRYDDSTRTSEFKLIVLPANTTAEDFKDDPALGIGLQDACFESFGSCGGSCSVPPCFDLAALCGLKGVMCVCGPTECP